MKTHYRSIALAILAAACYGVSAPLAKLLLQDLSPTMMAGLLYLGAGIGMSIVHFVTKDKSKEAPLTRKERPFVWGMILLDIAAPIFLMLGLSSTTPGNASLLNNFEIVATSLIALFIFKEAIGKRMWMAIAWITLASVILSFDMDSLKFSYGSMMVLAACICWGFENNCTRMLSLKNPIEIVIIKGLGSGTGALLIALLTGQAQGSLRYILSAALLGFFAYGMSIYFYILAQRDLGASRTSAYYAIAPFIGLVLSFAMFEEAMNIQFVLAILVMLIGTYYATFEGHSHLHSHAQLHHEHRHRHDDGHHTHHHDEKVTEHSHPHTHEETEHSHPHTPDLHHRHKH